MNLVRVAWSESELLKALELYILEPKISRSSPKLANLALEIGRSPGSVYARLQNFKAVDPEYPGRGLIAGVKTCQPIWDKYSDSLKNGRSIEKSPSGIVLVNDQSWRGIVKNIIYKYFRHQEFFTMSELLTHEEYFQQKFPNNNFPRRKVAQVLQQMRDDGELEFVDNQGTYKLSSNFIPYMYPEERLDRQNLLEGTSMIVQVTVYERNRSARTLCLNHHGYDCKVCGFSFLKSFGEIGRDYIHVHHLQTVSSRKEIYKVDPVKDLIPICPNCHAMIHTSNPPMSVEELRIILQKAREEPRR